MTADHWQDYWASGGTSERALGDAAQRTFLANHWRALFDAHAQPNTCVVDIACGDGAVFACAKASLSAPGVTMVATDAAHAGVRAAVRKLPGTIGVASTAGRLPFADRAMDIVVSQFGLEYGGAQAFAEAARIVKANGVFSAICHLKGGGIDGECAENARMLHEYAASRLGKYARAALAASFESRTAPRTPQERAIETAFQDAARRAAGAVQNAPNSAARSMLGSALQEITALAARRFAYDPTEALAFVDHVDASLSAYHARMRSMLAAALDQNAIGAIAEVFQSAKLIRFSATQVAFAPGAAASAWRIEARRA